MRTLTATNLGYDTVRIAGEGWDPELGEVWFGPDGVQGADGAPSRYSLARADGKFDVTMKEFNSGIYTYVFWQSGDSAVESITFEVAP